MAVFNQYFTFAKLIMADFVDIHFICMETPILVKVAWKESLLFGFSSERAALSETAIRFEVWRRQNSEAQITNIFMGAEPWNTDHQYFCGGGFLKGIEIKCHSMTAVKTNKHSNYYTYSQIPSE